MFGRTRTVSHETHVSAARGGISGAAIITGVVVAFGAMFLLSALAGGILTAAGITPDEVADETGVIEATVGAGIVVVIAQFLAYLWGGYTAGRMARGAGVVNGSLVPLIAIVIAVAVGWVVASLGATANLNLPFSTSRLPLEGDYLIDWGTAIAVSTLVAMFLGGALGGGLGSRWHTRLEHRHEEEIAEERREAIAATSPTNGDGATTTTATTTPVAGEKATSNPTNRT